MPSLPPLAMTMSTATVEDQSNVPLSMSTPEIVIPAFVPFASSEPSNL